MIELAEEHKSPHHATWVSVYMMGQDFRARGNDR